MKHIYIICIIVFFASCSTSKNTNPILEQADSLLEANPDSVFVLLKSLPSPHKMSEADYAHYALLMTAATDKKELSLIPCDSLINFALDYYDDDEKEKATALLYRGRLLGEIGETAEAINCSMQALEILNSYPKELKSKRLIYSALGNWYIDNKLYDKALEVLNEELEYANTDLSKSIALNNLSNVYWGLNKTDSVLIIQNEAIKYALLSNDSSMIRTCLRNQSLYLNIFEEFDSAMVYAQKALLYLPEKGDEGCYFNLGDLYLSEGKFDSSRYYLEKSLLDTDLYQKRVTYGALAFLEKELGNFESAFNNLEEFVNIADSLNDENKMMEVGRLVYKHNAEMQVENEHIKAQHFIGASIAVGLFICFMIILIYQNRLNKRKRLQLFYEQSSKDMEYKQTVLQKNIEDNRTMIAFLQQGQKDTKEEIKQREQTIDQLKEEKLRLRNWLFEQSDIYKKVYAISQQTDIEEKKRKVLTTVEQDKLQQTIFGIYEEYVSYLKKEYPRLMDKDILLLCLQKTKLSSLTIALCFGSTNTQAINQRKSRLKDRMNGENK